MNDRKRSVAAAFRLTLLVLEGYLYILLVVGVFLGVLAWLAWGIATRRPFVALTGVFIGLPVLLATAAALRALAAREPVTEGLAIPPEEAPPLHAMVEGLRLRLRAPRVQRIVLGPAVNATAMQLPRFLLFWPRNVLRLGFPLLVALSPDELRTVVAHELAHFSRAHGRFSLWIYRTRLAWLRLVHALHTRGTAPTFVYWLHHRYVPRLDAMSASVARDQELLADRCAARVVGARAAADTLVAIEMVSRYHDDVFWPALRERLERDSDAVRPFTAMAAELRRWRTADEGLLEQGLSQEDDPGATHPSLTERLRAIGEAARVPRADGPSAGEAFLGARLLGFASLLDEQWAARHGEAWRSHHAELRRDRERLAVLSGLAAPSAQERLERGRLLERLEGPDAALPIYRSALEAGSRAAAVDAGRLLLEQGEEEGVALIEEAIGADETLMVAGSEPLIEFHLARGRLHDAERCESRLKRYRMRSRLAEEERAVVSPLDRLAPHGLADGQVAAVRAELARHPAVLRAWLAKREFRHAAGDEFLLGVIARGVAEAGELGPAGAGVLPGATRLLLLETAHPEVRKRLEALPGSCVYP